MAQSSAVPVVEAISPNHGNLGNSVDVTLTGVNLAGVTAIVVSGGGVTASNINATSTSVTATLSITSTASLGYRQVTVATPLGTSAARTFTVLPQLPAPAIHTISPNFGYLGTSVDVTLTGSNFFAASGATTVSVSGAGVTADNPSSVRPGTLTVRLNIAGDAALGPRQISVTTPSGASNVIEFNVASTVPAPILDAIAPNFGSPGRFVDVTLTGGNFIVSLTPTTANSVTVSGGGVRVNNVTTCYVCHDGRRDPVLTTTLAISPGASLGYRAITVTTPGGASNSRTFTVVPATDSPPAPTLSTMSLNSGMTGQQVNVTLTGTNFVPEQTEVLADGIAVGSVSPVNATTLTASFTLPSVAGVENVRVRTPSGTSSDSIPFTVRATISASVGPGGSISPSGVVSVDPGASQTFMIMPDPGYSVSYISVDGVSVGPANSYTFPTVTSNHTIAVTFAATSVSLWTTLAPMSTARYFLSAAEIDGKLYAVGGYDPLQNRDTPILEVYNPATNIWSALASLPDLGDGNSGRYQATAGVIDGKLYLAGGWRNTSASTRAATSSLLIYNPTANSWTMGRSIPALSACSSGGVIDRKFYVLSGCDGYGWRSDFYVYAPDTDAWAPETSPPDIHVGGGAVVLNGKLYVIGGHNGVVSARVDVFNPADHSWTTVAPMLTARENVMAAVIGGKIYALGGNPNGAATSIVEVYDPSSNTWTAGDPLPSPRNAAAAVAISGKIYVVGGENGGAAVNTLFVYTPTVFDPNIGTRVATCDDCSVGVPLPFPFTFFGQTYTHVFVNNNGHLTFNFSEWDYTETVGEFNQQPRISAFWDDIIVTSSSPADAGLYINSQIPSKFVVTWFKQQEFCCVGNSTIQATLFSDGRIQFVYNGVTALDAIVGLTPGGNVSIQQVDFSAGSTFSIGSATAILEQFTTPVPFGTTDPSGSGAGTNHVFDLDNHSLLMVPNVNGGYDVSFHTATPTATGTVEGTVYDFSGSPAAGAQVIVRSSGDANFSATATTDSNGRYRVSNVIVGGVNVVRILDGNNAGRGAGHLREQGETLILDVHPLSPQVK